MRAIVVALSVIAHTVLVAMTTEKTAKSIKKAPKRTRKNVTITLSEEARIMGDDLAEGRGMKFAQLVEQLLRAELRKAGLMRDSAL